MVHSTESIVVTELEVVRGAKRVLPGISLAIRGGVVTGLVGPSGCGKSTLLRSIVGVQMIEGGGVVVLGEPAGTPGLRRRVAYVTQSPSIYGDLTVRQNLNFFARVLRVPRHRVDATVDTMALTAEIDQVAASLSGGERSRASLAVALLADPDVFVLDEPTVGLDPVLRGSLWRTFHALAERGATVLVSTHVMDEAERCDDLVLMRSGRIIAVASPQELRERTHATDLESAFLSLAEAAS